MSRANQVISIKIKKIIVDKVKLELHVAASVDVSIDYTPETNGEGWQNLFILNYLKLNSPASACKVLAQANCVR